MVRVTGMCKARQERKNRNISNWKLTSFKRCSNWTLLPWKHFLISYLETLPSLFTFRIRVTVEHGLLSSASRGCRGLAVISIRTEKMGYEPWLLMEATASSPYHSAWQTERKQIQIERKKSQACLCVLTSLSVEEHFQNNSNKTTSLWT